MTDRRHHHGYEDLDGDLVEAWEREHRNGDRTQVVVLDVNDLNLVVATDVDDQGEPLKAELIDVCLTPDEARGRARVWIENNETGVDNGGGGLRDTLNL